MKVLHVVTGLNNGGAEGVLYRLCKHEDRHQHVIISMMDEGKYGPLLKDSGIEVHCLNMPQGRLSISGLWRLFKLISNIEFSIVEISR